MTGNRARLTQSDVSHHATRIRDMLTQRWPEASRLAPEDPIACLRHITDLKVRVTAGTGNASCPIAGDYDGEVEPPLLTICPSGNDRRDGFTALHELGHHLLYDDSTWQYEISPGLEDVRADEERVVNSFAAGILVNDSMITSCLSPDVTAAGISRLAHATRASLTACCVQALERPGNRLIMIASPNGRVWFSLSNDDIFNPGRRVIQPMLANAAEQAQRHGGCVVVEGGEGLRYFSGKTWLVARADVCVDGDVVIVVIVTGRRKRPDEKTWGTWDIECPKCAEHYTPASSSGECRRCGQSRCPRCGTCDCPSKSLPICSECFIELSVSEASCGQTLCGNCS